LIPASFSLHTVFGVSFVVSNVHYKQRVVPNLIKYMIGKSAQIGATKIVIGEMETKWVGGKPLQ
jgi:hypothetical protein